LHNQLDATQALAQPEALYQHLRTALLGHIQARAINAPVLIGIHTGGYAVAQRLQMDLSADLAPNAAVDLSAGLTPAPAHQLALGGLNIAFYRDDFAHAGLSHERASSSIPVDINARHVILIDDILYTGRTIRAAINELFDYGRPASITLACLIARDGRELPIQPDVCGAWISLSPRQVIKLEQTNPIRLRLLERSV
jgi:pyrimidine operon attenuation protein / uracil phosphoribosyltransferase